MKSFFSSQIHTQMFQANQMHQRSQKSTAPTSLSPGLHQNPMAVAPSLATSLRGKIPPLQDGSKPPRKLSLIQSLLSRILQKDRLMSSVWQLLIKLELDHLVSLLNPRNVKHHMVSVGQCVLKHYQYPRGWPLHMVNWYRQLCKGLFILALWCWYIKQFYFLLQLNTSHHISKLIWVHFCCKTAVQ